MPVIPLKYSPVAVSRPTATGYVMLAIGVNWDQKRDTLWFDVDGYRKEWYRRSMPVFDCWAACSSWIREKGYPVEKF